MSGLPSGVTASFSPASVSAGQSSTLTLTAASSSGAATAAATVTGTATSGTHSAGLSVAGTANTPPPAGNLVNGDFESGLTGWTGTNKTSSSTDVHGDRASGQVGSTAPFNGHSTLSQTLVVPATGVTTLSFWWKGFNPGGDTTQYSRPSTSRATTTATQPTRPGWRSTTSPSPPPRPTSHRLPSRSRRLRAAGADRFGLRARGAVALLRVRRQNAAMDHQRPAQRAEPVRLASGHVVRLLVPGDEPAAEGFLRAHWQSSMFLLSNLAGAGLGGSGGLQDGTWAAAFAPAREGIAPAIEALAGHFGFGSITLQAPGPALLPPVVQLAAAASGRPVKGVGGPWEQVVAGCEALGRAGDPVLLAEPELLYTLELSALQLPTALSDGRLRVRRAGERDLEALLPWRRAYLVEATVEADGPQLEATARGGLGYACQRGWLFLLEQDGRPAATSAFNAAAAGAVQVGGVYTPPEARGLGLGRAVVAGSLALAHEEGAERAILFTPQSNTQAQRAYRALGFREIGRYGLTLFAQPRAGL